MGGYGVGEGWDECGSLIRKGRQGVGMTFGIRESYWGDWSIRKWI